MSGFNECIGGEGEVDTTNLIIVVVVLISFVVIVTLMIRRSMNYTEDLREELKSGFKIPSVDEDGIPSSKEMRSRSIRGMYLVNTGFYVLLMILGWDSFSFAELFGLTVVYVIAMVVVTGIAHTDNRKESDKFDRLRKNPLPLEVINSLESYLRFVEKEDIDSSNVGYRSYRLGENVHNGERNIDIDIGFLDRERVPDTVRRDIQLFKSRFDFAIVHNSVYTETYNKVVWIVLLITVLISFTFWILSELSLL